MHCTLLEGISFLFRVSKRKYIFLVTEAYNKHTGGDGEEPRVVGLQQKDFL